MNLKLTASEERNGKSVLMIVDFNGLAKNW